MELILNLVWMVLVALMFWLWLRHAPREGESRKMQFVALAIVLLILLPVISVTDDLMAAQNPAETNSCQRRDHALSIARSTHFHATAAIPPVLAEISYSHQRYVLVNNSPFQRVINPALASIQNRPPPTV